MIDNNIKRITIEKVSKKFFPDFKNNEGALFRIISFLCRSISSNKYSGAKSSISSEKISFLVRPSDAIIAEIITLVSITNFKFSPAR